MLITRTPYRLSLFGGGLDYPEWYQRKETRVLSSALDYYCYQTVRVLPPFFNHKYRAAYSSVECVDELNKIQHPAIREVIRRYAPNTAIEVSHIGDLPAKSGIGSSSAFTVGLILSINALQGRYLGRTELALAAISLEQEFMNEAVGFQDQCAAAFGGFVLIDAGCEGIRPRAFTISKQYINYLESNLLLGFDGIDRFSGLASQKTKEAIYSTKYDELLVRLSELSDQGIKAIGENSDVSELAKLTKASRDIKLVLNGDTCNKRSLEIIARTEAAGSLCTKVMGAGGGGFFICFAPPYRHEDIKESVGVKTWVDVRFSSSGSQVIFTGS
jgi:D-glycero-alpha-D-manno-heptose-7-phosphate kinase